MTSISGNSSSPASTSSSASDSTRTDKRSVQGGVVQSAPELIHQLLKAYALLRGNEEDMPAVGFRALPESGQFLVCEKVNLVDDLNLLMFREFGIKGGQLIVDEPEAGPGIVAIHILNAQDVHKEPRPLNVLQETQSESLPLAGAFNKARDVGDDETPSGIIRMDHHAEHRHQRREGIAGDFRPGRRNLRKKCGLAGVGQTEKTRVSENLEFQPERVFLTRLTGLGEMRGPHGRALEMNVAETAAAAFGHDEFLIRLAQVGEKMLFIPALDINHGANGQMQDQIFALSPIHLAAHSVLAVLGRVMTLQTEVVQREQSAIGAQNDRAAVAAVAAVRAALGNKFFPAEMDAAAAAVSGLYGYPCFIDESHGKPLLLPASAEGAMTKKGKKPCGPFPSKVL